MLWSNECDEDIEFESKAHAKRGRVDSVVADLARLEQMAAEEVELPDAAVDLLDRADELDDEARHNEELAAVAITDNARRRLLWEANQKHGEAVRRWVEAQRIIKPARQEVFRVGGVVVYEDDADFSEYANPVNGWT